MLTQLFAQSAPRAETDWTTVSIAIGAVLTPILAGVGTAIGFIVKHLAEQRKLDRELFVMAVKSVESLSTKLDAKVDHLRESIARDFKDQTTSVKSSLDSVRFAIDNYKVGRKTAVNPRDKTTHHQPSQPEET